jgi:hypothetical protein
MLSFRISKKPGKFDVEEIDSQTYRVFGTQVVSFYLVQLILENPEIQILFY